MIAYKMIDDAVFWRNCFTAGIRAKRRNANESGSGKISDCSHSEKPDLKNAAALKDG